MSFESTIPSLSKSVLSFSQASPMPSPSESFWSPLETNLQLSTLLLIPSPSTSTD
ncbi:MAG: hypothetical protein MRJ97_05145 [Candidatus Nitrosocosmicus sp.]|nr:hypothetical protein [Candidatus Nitrosocosmicus sp. SS]MDR4490277.1 hypothetical protein [Candidatus Nitrosocosmicus sp.]